jgi:2-hydroxy-6-oxonona-2,4-dienedioate hydrolase
VDVDALSPITWEDYRKCGYGRLLRTFHHQLHDPIEAKLPQIRAPVLVVRGQHDPICGPNWAAEVARRLPDGRHAEIPGVSHTLVYTSPEELAGVTLMFLRESWRQAAPLPAP